MPLSEHYVRGLNLTEWLAIMRDCSLRPLAALVALARPIKVHDANVFRLLRQSYARKSLLMTDIVRSRIINC